MQQLAKRAEKLREQDLTMVLVQISKVEPEALDQWLAKHESPFERGILKGDLEKKKLEWGVRSLPWLILADREHTVRAEGFGINELDDTLNQDDGD